MFKKNKFFIPTIVGAIFLVALSNLLLASFKISLNELEILLKVNKDNITPISFIFLAISYLVGTLIATCIEEHHDYARYIIFLKDATEEFIQEYKTRIEQNILCKLLSVAIPILGSAAVFWQIMINIKIIYLLAIFSPFFILSCLSVFAYQKSKKTLTQFRNYAFEEFDQNINIEKT